MKLLKDSIDDKGVGSLILGAEEAEDMWHVYNVITVGDKVCASTIRKVTLVTDTGSTVTNKVRTTLTIQAENIDFDTQACMLRVKGRNVCENKYVKMGAYHTLDLEMNRRFKLHKDEWDSVALDRIDMACDPTQNADLAAVVMQEGLAHVCLVTNTMTLVRAKIQTNIPRKRKGLCDQHTKGLNRFYNQIMQAVLKHVNFDVVKCIVIASPGFVKDQFAQYMFAEAMNQDHKVLTENRSKFVMVHSSSGFKHSLKEALIDPTVVARMADTKATAEVRALDSFYHMLQNDPDRAFYGVKHCEKAASLLAVDTLLISDELFRSQDIQQRKRYVRLVDSVKDGSGDVNIFSSLHISGEQLGQLSGVAAILRFPVQDDEESEED